MKLSVALLSANIIAITAKKPCTASLPDLGKGSWSSCSTDLLTPFFNHGDTCRITGDGCNGQVKCWKGNWIGKTSRFCPKDCEGAPNQPAFGGKLVCEDGVCVLNSETGFQCSSSVKCDTKKGRWTGKSKCVFEAYSSAEGRKNPPLRPDGSWKCDRKCKFTCDDGSSGGRGVITKKGWVYDSDWEVCIGKTIVSTVTAPETTKATTPAETSGTDPATSQPTTIKPTSQPTSAPTTEAITVSCTGTPAQPAFGGKFECEDGNCVLNIEEGFKCSNSVKCSRGKWTGKAKCSFADYSSFEAKTNPPSRPAGSWECSNCPFKSCSDHTLQTSTYVGKCKFTCNDGSNGGTGRVSKRGWIYDLDFDICLIRANVAPDSCSCLSTVDQTKCSVVTDCDSCENLQIKINGDTVQWKYNDEEKTCRRHYYFCQCPNGTPVIGHGYGGQVCQKTGHLRCESCDAGFRLKDHKYKYLFFCAEIPQFP